MVKQNIIRGVLCALLALTLVLSATAQITRIAFGSCAHQDRSQPLLKLAAAYNPDRFIFLGDNIYGDTDNMDTLRAMARSVSILSVSPYILSPKKIKRSGL